MEMVFESAEAIANYPDALWKTVHEKDEKEMILLLEGGADTEFMGGFEFRKTTPLQLAVRMNEYTTVKLLLEHGANVHVRNRFGETLLHNAVMMLGESDTYLMARILIANGVVVDSVDYLGWTALHTASFRNMCDVIRLLLLGKADVTLKTAGNQSAFQLASLTKNKEMLKEAEVKAEEAHVNDTCLAFAMGQHKRLGQGTLINDLHPELLRMVLKYRGV